MMAGIYEKKGDAKLAEYEYLLGGKSKAVRPPPSPRLTAAQPSQPSQPSVGGSNDPGMLKVIETLKGSLKEHPEQVEL